MNNATRAIEYAKRALAILDADEERLEKIDNYFLGNHLKPYMPESANQEYRDLAERCITNWMPTLVSTSAQALYVDNFRRDEKDVDAPQDESPEWEHWQRSRLDANQGPIYQAALKFGHSYSATERDLKGRPTTRGLSTLRTVTLYEDAATDLDPEAGVYFRRFAKSTTEGDKFNGLAFVWDDENKYELAYNADDEWVCRSEEPHGATQCPVTRFHAYKDLEGRTWGVIEPAFALQDRINQTIFDLMMGQTYSSFNVRFVTGMAPPMRMTRGSDGEAVPMLDDDGNPMPDPQVLNATRWFYSDDPDVKFGQLEGADLTGFIEAAELAVRHLSAMSQTPPHFLLGQIANISAEALQAAEVALSRKIEEFRTSFGESWERVMRIAAEMNGDTEAADDYSGEVIWRDLGASSLAQSADALGKFADALGIPKRGLWPRVPKATRSEVAQWERLRQEDDKEQQLVDRAVGQNPQQWQQPPAATEPTPAPRAFAASAR